VRTYGTLEHHPNDSWFGRGGCWKLTAEPNVIMRVKRIFPRVAVKREGWLALGDTPEVARDLTWLMERWPLQMDAAALARLEGRTTEYVEAQEAVERVLSGERLTFDGGQAPAREPRDYQVVAADIVLSVGRLLLIDDLGLGKTFTGLLVLREPRALPAVVVCPTHLQRQWLRELGLSFPMLRGHIVTRVEPYDPVKKYGREMRGQHPDVLIVPYSKIASWGHHLAGHARTVIFDEVQELRRTGTQKYTGAAMVADAAEFRMGLTATPVYNYGGEIHSVISVLDKEALGTRKEFIEEWGRETNGKVFVKDPRALGAHMRQERLLLRRTRAEVGRELPEVVRIPHTVDADERVIDRETSSAADLAELILTGAGTHRERFTAAGDLDWQMRRATGLAKAPYVADFVRLILDSEPKAILFGWHRDVYELWLDRIADLKPTLYTGSESPAAKEKARERFLTDDDCRVLVMSLRSGAGLDGLQEACKVAVFGELDWSPAQHDQCIGRLHRDGQADPVVAYFLTCEHGSDPVVMEALGIKRGQAEPLRDPDAKLFEQAAPDAKDRVRRLAEQVRQRTAGKAAA
jgi:superfamily II DNA or RNA helicase